MNTLPFLTRLIIGTVLAQQNKVLIAELAYLRAEIDYLHAQLPEGHQLRFTDRWRKRLARAAAEVGWKRVAEIASVAKGATIRGWYRLMRKGTLGVKRAKSGRPKTNAEVAKLIIRMAQENATWGQERIAGELVTLGIAISPRTIATILDHDGLRPAPQRTTDWSWKQFVTEKADALVATDFFTVDIWGWLGKTSYDVLFAIHLSTRQVEIMGVTQHSNEDYMAQLARNATMDDGWLKKMGCRYVIHDRDSKFCGRWKEILNAAGVETVPIPARSPNLNAFAERWVRTVKRECVRKLWFISYNGLVEVLNEYVRVHYNLERPHQGRGNRPLPASEQAKPRPQKLIAGLKASQIRCVTRCRGVVRHYYRAAA